MWPGKIGSMAFLTRSSARAGNRALSKIKQRDAGVNSTGCTSSQVLSTPQTFVKMALFSFAGYKISATWRELLEACLVPTSVNYHRNVQVSIHLNQC